MEWTALHDISILKYALCLIIVICTNIPVQEPVILKFDVVFILEYKMFVMSSKFF